MNEWNVGDKVWWSDCGSREVEKTCPVCFGQRWVILILGDGTHVKTPCDFCGHGFEGPRGYVTEYEWVAEPKEVTITGRRVEEGGLSRHPRDNSGRVVEYEVSGRWWPKDTELFDAEGPCRARCEERIKEFTEEQAGRGKSIKEHHHKKYSWRVGYHRKEAKDHRHQAEYHETKAVICAQHVRAEKEKA